MDPDHAPPSAWGDCDFGDDGWLTGVHLNDTWCQTELNNKLCGFDGGMSGRVDALLLLVGYSLLLP